MPPACHTDKEVPLAHIWVIHSIWLYVQMCEHTHTVMCTHE